MRVAIFADRPYGFACRLDFFWGMRGDFLTTFSLVAEW